VILSKRERYAATVTVAAVSILLLDYYVLGPLLAMRSQLETEKNARSVQMQKASRLLANKSELQRKWGEMARDGLSGDASAAESQVLHAVRDWAAETGLSLSSLKPERTEQDKLFHKIVFRATGTGTMSQVGQFLWRIQKAQFPVRITDMQLNARKEGTDDLSLQIGISTLYLAPEAEKSPARASLHLGRDDE
jgi:Tfp pilus assembly protein PilO